MQLQARSYGDLFSDFLRAYYHGPDHPSKLRILKWIESLAGNKRILVKTGAGFRFAVDRRDYIQRTVFESRTWEPEIERILQAVICPGDIFYDIGANVGYFSLLALQMGCDCVIAFEPRLELAAIYRHNMEINQFSNSKWNLLNEALSDSPGTSFYVPGPIENSGIGHLASGFSDGGTMIEVQTLDDVIESKQLLIPTVIKMDVEGWELQILKGAVRTFSNNPPRVVIFEADADSSGGILDPTLASFFIQRGYSIKLLKREMCICEAKENYIATRNEIP